MNIGKELVNWMTRAFGTYSVVLMTYKLRKEHGIELNTDDCKTVLAAIDEDIEKCHQLIAVIQLAMEMGEVEAVSNTIALLGAAEVEFKSYRFYIAELFGLENK